MPGRGNDLNAESTEIDNYVVFQKQCFLLRLVIEIADHNIFPDFAIMFFFNTIPVQKDFDVSQRWKITLRKSQSTVVKKV